MSETEIFVPEIWDEGLTVAFKNSKVSRPSVLCFLPRRLFFHSANLVYLLCPSLLSYLLHFIQPVSLPQSVLLSITPSIHPSMNSTNLHIHFSSSNRWLSHATSLKQSIECWLFSFPPFTNSPIHPIHPFTNSPIHQFACSIFITHISHPPIHLNSPKLSCSLNRWSNHTSYKCR